MIRGFELWLCSWTHTQRKQKYPHFITQSLMKSNSNTRSPKPRWIQEVIPGQLLQPRDDVLLSTFLTSVALFDFMLKSCFTLFNLKLQKKALLLTLPPPFPPYCMSSSLGGREPEPFHRGRVSWAQLFPVTSFSPFLWKCVCVCVCVYSSFCAHWSYKFFFLQTHTHTAEPLQ